MQNQDSFVVLMTAGELREALGAQPHVSTGLTWTPAACGEEILGQAGEIDSELEDLSLIVQVMSEMDSVVQERTLDYLLSRFGS